MARLSFNSVMHAEIGGLYQIRVPEMYKNRSITYVLFMEGLIKSGGNWDSEFAVKTHFGVLINYHDYMFFLVTTVNFLVLPLWTSMIKAIRVSVGLFIFQFWW